MRFMTTMCNKTKAAHTATARLRVAQKYADNLVGRCAHRRMCNLQQTLHSWHITYSACRASACVIEAADWYAECGASDMCSWPACHATRLMEKWYMRHATHPPIGRCGAHITKCASLLRSACAAALARQPARRGPPAGCITRPHRRQARRVGKSRAQEMRWAIMKFPCAHLEFALRRDSE